MDYCSGLRLVSIAVGLAFKDIFENFFAGILIRWRCRFERGDFIECEGLVGKVERVMVRVRRPTGEVVSAVKAALDKAGIEIPFPYRTLTFKEALPLQRTE